MKRCPRGKLHLGRFCTCFEEATIPGQPTGLVYDLDHECLLHPGEAPLLDRMHIGRREQRQHVERERLLDDVQTAGARMAQGEARIGQPAGLNQIGFRNAEFPGTACIFDRTQGRSPGASFMAADKDDVGMRFCNAGGKPRCVSV